MESEVKPPAAEAASPVKRRTLGKWWTYVIVLAIGLLIGGTVMARVVQNQAAKHGGAKWVRDGKTGRMVFLWPDQYGQVKSFDNPNERPPIDNCAPTTDDTEASK